MSDKEFKSYKKIHDYSNPSEIEKGKIKKETTKYIKHSKKSKELTNNILRNLRDLSDYDESLADEVAIENEKSNKEKGNARTHKKRFKKFDKYDEFN